MNKVPCKKCGTKILPLTAAENDDMCVPCCRSCRLRNRILAKFNRVFGPIVTWITEPP